MKIKLIYLAAGNSRRFGSNKLCQLIQGRPMYCYGLDVLTEVLRINMQTDLVVVTEFSDIQEQVRQMELYRAGRILLTGSPEREKGISYSIRAGLAAAGEADYYLFCVADQPWIRTETVLELLDRTVRGGYAGGYVAWQEHSGNPALFSKRLLPQLLELQGDTGGKKLLLGRKDVCIVQAQSLEEMRDIDEKTEI
jgi:molybdenum cofactor cytidylyltransferase